MRLNALTQMILVIAMAIGGYYYVVDMVQPTIDLYTIPMVEGRINAATCTTDSECGCVDDCLAPTK